MFLKIFALHSDFDTKWQAFIKQCFDPFFLYSHEWPLSGQPWEVESEELPLEAVVQLDELGIPPARGRNRIKLFLQEQEHTKFYDLRQGIT